MDKKDFDRYLRLPFAFHLNSKDFEDKKIQFQILQILQNQCLQEQRLMKLEQKLDQLLLLFQQRTNPVIGPTPPTTPLLHHELNIIDDYSSTRTS